MATFTDLKFEERKGLPGIRAFHLFENGYGASVVKGYGTYGGDEGLYELAVVGPNGSLAYDTPVTDDVLGYLSETDVTEALAKIEALPVRASTSA